ncbi:MAG: helix-turn-helix domain-containing protein [Firmicutes bacterium]|nr:helix-turn-helix domain-containing protein [Bacillota bacterium]
MNSIKQKIKDNSCLLNTLLGNLDCKDLQLCYNLIESDNVQQFLADPDLVSTAESFFDNNLNITKTSKTAFMHRNTLLYRIEKIQAMVGLDMRNFEDAITLKIVLILSKRECSAK